MKATGHLWASVAMRLCGIAVGLTQLAVAEGAEPDLKRAASVALSNAVSVVIYPKVDVDEPLIRMVEGERCPNCGRFHSEDLSALVKRESGVLVAGFLVAPDCVICQDQLFAPENIASISVSRGGRSVSALIEKRFVSQHALLLKLGQPLSSGDVVGVDAHAEQPVRAVTVTRQARDVHAFQAIPKSLHSAQVFGERGDAWALLDVPAVLMDARNRICGYAFDGEWRANDSANPARWPAYTAEELDRRLAQAARRCEQSVLPVALSYRSPRMSRGGEDMFSRRTLRGRSDGEGETETELNTVGVLVSDRRIFIRIGDGKEKLVRLEHIRVYFPQGPVEASFVCALASFRGLIAELPQPHGEQVLRVASDPVGHQSGELSFLCRVDVSGRGSVRVRTTPVRVKDAELGWRGYVATDLSVEQGENFFVFSADGVCLWWKASISMDNDSIGESSRHWSSGDSESTFLAASTLAALAQPNGRDIDAAVRPASPEDENRLGWLGVDLQPITPELAESKKAMADTGGGKFGALVTHVYPDSPAAQAGVKEGWVLVSVSPANHTLPLKVEMEENESPYHSDFPWERLDQIPSEYMDRLPTPWPTAANAFVTGLTKLGIGSKISATFLSDGVKTVKSMVIALAPPNYESAPSFKWKAGGISVRDLTQEVRDYLSLPGDAPGVVVCRVESSGKAVTAGIRPFEVIMRFNGKPVFSAKEFEALSRDATDIRLDVKRMTRERVVSFSVAPSK